VKKTQAVNARLKDEFSTRSRLKLPPLHQWLFPSRFKEKLPFVEEANFKINKRLDLTRFLNEQKMSKLAIRGLLTHGQFLFI
jgi:hypothetical protein